VAFDAGTGSVFELLGRDKRRTAELARRQLSGQPGVHLDPLWERTVRAYRLDRRGNRRGLSPDLVDAALAAAGHELRAVPGWSQTDFVPAGVDKGTGLRALLEVVSPEEASEERPLALAVGDAETDLPMLALAQRRWAPANAAHELRAAGIQVARRRFQSGLAEAVGSLIGHRPGGCRRCRTPELPAADRLLLMALGAGDAGRWGRVALGWRLYREVPG
jgi:hypothetical protein